MRSSLLVLSLAFGSLAVAQSFPESFAYSFQSPFGSGSRIGVELRDLDSDRANVLKMEELRGVEVVSVIEDSPAEEAGIKKGDVLLTFNGENIVGAQQLGRLVSETPRGRKVKIQYWRDGKVNTTTVTTAAPSARMMQIPGMNSISLPEVRELRMPDIPTPQLIWRNSLLGMECESLDPQLAEYFGVKHGVLVRSVAKDSPAGRAGLHAGDVITNVGNRTVNDPKELASYARSERRGTKVVSLEVTRDHKPVSMKVNVAPVQEE